MRASLAVVPRSHESSHPDAAWIKKHVPVLEVGRSLGLPIRVAVEQDAGGLTITGMATQIHRSIFTSARIASAVSSAICAVATRTLT